ncbi:hypothetical protein V8F06_001670 [Rhypophila decipiens]
MHIMADIGGDIDLNSPPQVEGHTRRGPSLRSGEEGAATHAHQQLIVPAASSSSSKTESRPKVSCTTSTLSSDITGAGSGIRTPLSISNRTSSSAATFVFPARKDSSDSNMAACREGAPCVHQSSCDELPTTNGNRPTLSDTTSGSISTGTYEPPAYSNHHNYQHVRRDVRADDAILCRPNGAISNTSAGHGLELDSLLLGVGAWSVFHGSV